MFIKLERMFKDRIDVKKLARYIVSNVHELKQQVSKNIARFVPIELATKAKFDLFKLEAPKIIEKYFPQNLEGIIKKTVKLYFIYFN